MSKGNDAEGPQQGDDEADPTPTLEAGESIFAEEKTSVWVGSLIWDAEQKSSTNHAAKALKNAPLEII